MTARVLPDGVPRELMTRRAEVPTALPGLIADRLRWANRRRLDFHGYPARAQLARMPAELAASHGSSRTGRATTGYRLTQPEPAMLIGAARPPSTRSA
jgi:CRP/FNR family cyclic AMP-dependent transcriptional regulator